MHGTGIYKYRNGKIYKGLFQEGQIVHNENININNSLNNSKINYINDTEQFDYTNPIRKIESLNIEDNEDDVVDFRTSKIYQNINENINTSKYQSKTYNIRKGNKSYTKNDLDENMININQFKQNNDLNNQDKKDFKNPELMLSSYRNFGFGSTLDK